MSQDYVTGKRGISKERAEGISGQLGQFATRRSQVDGFEDWPTGLNRPLSKWLISVAGLPAAISEDAVYAAPPPQQYKAAPPGTLSQEHRADPRSSHSTGLRPYNSLNRIGSASGLPRPVLRGKRRCQLAQNTPPQGPYVLHLSHVKHYCRSLLPH